MYEADGDGDDAPGEEGEDCIDSGDIAMALRDSMRGSTTAHGSITTDGAVSPPQAKNPPPLFGNNTSSTHEDSSLFRGEGKSAAPSFRAPDSSRRSEIELGGDLLSDSGRHDTHDDTLQCPRCKKEYPTQNHVDFLDHVDKCCD